MNCSAGSSRWRALVTRPREDAEAFVRALGARGVDALVEPMMQIQFHEGAPDLAGAQAVLCTSANGVRALARASSERRIPLFAVGDATAACARDLGFVTVKSAGGNVSNLARLVTERLRSTDGRVVHISGSEIAGNLAAELHSCGFVAERTVLYEACAATALSTTAIDALGAGEIDFALFFSPRTAAIFRRLLAAAGLGAACGKITAISISAAADCALSGIMWRERQIAERPDQKAMLDIVDRLMGERR